MIDKKIQIKKSKKDIKDELTREFILASKDENFQKLCSRLKCSDEILMKYTSKLEKTTEELSNCAKCKGLSECKLEIKGHIYYPNKKDEHLEFVYKPCKYFKKHTSEESKKAKTNFFETPLSLKNASLSDIIEEKERNKILKYMKTFLKKKISNEPVKGLYLSGSFGSGKSYLLSALLNELSLKGFKCANVYYPSLLKKLKSSFSDGSYEDVLEEIMTSEILLIDDIGAENNTSWARDEILSTILQFRMDNFLTTFFTSNFTINELENHLSETKDGIEQIKARRIIERIKNLTEQEELISSNKRR
ncbi:MAG: primosomal protein DnaI [Bacilli bacterium]|nr:primosomal protein DnaI [Bacilli bacterium]